MSAATVEGTYTLEEWYQNGEALRPPQVEGHFVLINGIAMTLLLNRAREATTTTALLTGHYTPREGLNKSTDHAANSLR